MKYAIFGAVAAIALTVGLTAAGAASAQVEFAVFNPVSSSTGGVVNFSEDSAGNLTSVSTKTPTVFTFDLTPLANFGDLKTNFNFSASESAPAAIGTLGGVSYVTAAYNGSFTYTYAGPTVTKGGVTLTTGETLLGGTFGNAAFAGRATASGGGLADDSLLGTVNYTSGIASSALPLATTGGSFSLAFIDISPVLGVQGGSLRDFTAVGDGKFSSDLITTSGGGGVPEPATWALMLLGVGGVGASLRRRGRTVSAAA